MLYEYVFRFSGMLFSTASSSPNSLEQSRSVYTALIAVLFKGDCAVTGVSVTGGRAAVVLRRLSANATSELRPSVSAKSDRVQGAGLRPTRAFGGKPRNNKETKKATTRMREIENEKRGVEIEK